MPTRGHADAWSSSEGWHTAAAVKFTVRARNAGRNVNGKCKKATRTNRKRRKCDLTLHGQFTHKGRQGKNSLRFTGKLKGKPLKPRSYRLVATASDKAGNKSRTKKATFKIAKPKHRRR